MRSNQSLFVHETESIQILDVNFHNAFYHLQLLSASTSTPEQPVCHVETMLPLDEQAPR